MRSLLLTLGHNSSAILVEDNRLVWGYETERFSHVKSDSRFPELVLTQKLGRTKVDMAYVSHWAPTAALSDMNSKHWMPEYLDGVPIRTLSPRTSHHDAHMRAAVCYAGPGFPIDNTICLVVDGFGTLGEHMSAYDLSTDPPKLVRRVHGYNTSLGLWYQYATSFLGMKMHEDEYKILGYETHVADEDVNKLIPLLDEIVEDWLHQMDQSVYGSEYDPMYDLSALSNARDRVYRILGRAMTALDLTDSSSERARAAVGWFVQAVLERVVLRFVGRIGPLNLLVSGGVFFNVKLNWLLLRSIEGKFCAYPLAGDQGCALGLYSMDNPDFEFPSDLNWGRRRLFSPGLVSGMEFFKSEDAAADRVLQLLKTVGAVNVVRGDMEFGPRALCNTSTLAMPNLSVVERINRANGRNTVMPMAPVMTYAMYKDLFEEQETSRVHHSERHMIMAMEYKEYPPDHMLGAAHEYNRPYHCHTGRPQVTYDPFVVKILMGVGHPLINTSFNVHGRPIVHDVADAVDNTLRQRSIDPSFRTVVVQHD
jgi:predicted NodU family carbamoyl transferase